MTTAAAVAAGGRGAVAQALNLLESTRPADRAAATALVDELAPATRPGCHVVGVTGPPGVGKSTLAGQLVAGWRARSLTVGVLAVDPSSLRTGGSLLGDRARMPRDEGDTRVFVRSMAAGDQLGGLAAATFDAALVMRAAFDRVLVETVGVGQVEGDVRFVADTTVVVVQPGSGDTLQFLKAGLMEIPDLFVVNKLDLGKPARRALRELAGALQILGSAPMPVIGVSATTGEGVAELLNALADARKHTADELAAARQLRMRRWTIRRHRDLHGRLSLEALGGEAGAMARLGQLAPGSAPSRLAAALEAD